MINDPELERELEILAGKEVQDIDGLGKLSIAVSKMMSVEREVADMENHLTILKQNLQRYKVDLIPNMMAELGLSELKTHDGHKLTIQTSVSCKFIPEVKPRALTWLAEHGHGPLIKSEVSLSFGKDSEAEVDKAVNALRGAGFEPDVGQDVHSSTLRAWASRQVEAGGAIPDDLFNISVFSMVKVK